jgi:hypothetical protein
MHRALRRFGQLVTVTGLSCFLVGIAMAQPFFVEFSHSIGAIAGTGAADTEIVDTGMLPVTFVDQPLTELSAMNAFGEAMFNLSGSASIGSISTSIDASAMTTHASTTARVQASHVSVVGLPRWKDTLTITSGGTFALTIELTSSVSGGPIAETMQSLEPGVDGLWARASFVRDQNTLFVVEDDIRDGNQGPEIRSVTLNQMFATEQVIELEGHLLTEVFGDSLNDVGVTVAIDAQAVFYIEPVTAGADYITASGVRYAPEPPLFTDVPFDHWAHDFIVTLADSGITSGCGGDLYCPASPVTRAQMAVFLVRGIHGTEFTPPAASGNVFVDVAATDFAADFIEQFFADGITSGCESQRYCAADPVTRAQMAVFLLRAKHGSGYTPPPATGVFDDVDLSHWAVAWIEQLAAEGITQGCGGSDYCPDAVVTRDQMAVFLVRTFGL